MTKARCFSWSDLRIGSHSGVSTIAPRDLFWDPAMARSNGLDIDNTLPYNTVCAQHCQAIHVLVRYGARGRGEVHGSEG